MSDILLDVKNLTVDFNTNDGNVRAVDDLSFVIPRGKTVGLVGESGSGKSVTSLAVMGLIPNPPGRVSRGEILFQGEDLLKKTDREIRSIRGNEISMIFQEPMTSLNPVFNVGTQISEVLRLHKKMSAKEAWEKSIELMDQVGIPDPARRASSYPHELSGGQKQRIMIAMAMACEPKLLICDEPTTALDVTIQKQVLDLMQELQDLYNMSMLFITHDLSVIADIADDVVVMYRSQMVEKGPIKQVFLDAKHPYTRGLLACRPGLETNPERLLTVSDFMDESGKELTPNQSNLKIQDKKFHYSEEDNPVILKVNNLKTYFPIKGGLMRRVVDHVKAVDDVSFELRRGKTLGLVGESGCGKTTLGRSILRLSETTSGQVYFKGEEISGLDSASFRPLRKKMQFIFQDPYSSLNPRMTVASILTEPMSIHKIGANQKERLNIAADLMERVGLKAEQLGRYPHEFSGGQRQRISIARALSVRPDFIICDESVSALDVSVQAQVLNLLLDLQDEFNLTYIFISHDLSVVNFFSDQVGVMYQGKIIEFGDAEKVYRHPDTDYTKRLLDAIPKGVVTA